jgi:1,4-alpha-glucan branching enzyme
LRELLALQSSDWAFLAAHGTAGAYPMERAAGHEAALEAALRDGAAAAPAVRNLAPYLASIHG